MDNQLMGHTFSDFEDLWLRDEGGCGAEAIIQSVKWPQNRDLPTW